MEWNALDRDAVVIDIPADFEAERRYILEAMMGRFSGLKYSINASSTNYPVWQFTLPNGNRLIVQDHFFSGIKENTGYISDANLPVKSRTMKMEASDLPLVYGTDLYSYRTENGRTEIITGNDIFATAFFSLSRWEEILWQGKTDVHQRFDENRLFAATNQLRHTPVVDLYSDRIRQWLIQLGCQNLEDAGSYQCMPGHDVDFFSRYGSWLLRNKARAGGLKREGWTGFRRIHREIAEVRAGLMNDPFDTYDWLMDQSEKINQVSTFYFLAPQFPDSILNYSLSDPEVKKVIQRITDRGHRIGLHGSYHSFTSREKLNAEKEQLESVAGPVLDTRQHFLRTRMPETWRLQASCGFSTDSSMGFSTGWGFRCGTCRAFPVFDAQNRTLTGIIEYPIILMDVALVRIQPGLTGFLDEATKIAEVVRKYKGNMVLIWHNSNLNLPEWHSLRNLYPELLSVLA
jgi:hypothetical protein